MEQTKDMEEDMKEEKEDMKYCYACEKVKPLSKENFYKAGERSWQKLCKICHNKTRKNYKPSVRKYKTKPTAFNKIPIDIQKQILYDISIKINYISIAKKYNLNYHTFLTWKRKGLLV